MIAISPHFQQDFLQPWRNQVGRHQRRRQRRGIRPFAALSYLTHGAAVDSLVDLRDILFFVLHDRSSSAGRIKLRLAGYRARSIPWGVKFGGLELNCLEKNLAVAPTVEKDAPWRLSPRNSDLLALGLHLDRALERCVRYSHMPRRVGPKLPKLFVKAKHHQLHGSGPEFEALADISPTLGRRRKIEDFCLFHRGQLLYPLEFVGHAWQLFDRVFVDLSSFPKRQLIRLDGPESLVGFQGACEFDFVRSRFSSQGIG